MQIAPCNHIAGNRDTVESSIIDFGTGQGPSRKAAIAPLMSAVPSDRTVPEGLYRSYIKSVAGINVPAVTSYSAVVRLHNSPSGSCKVIKTFPLASRPNAPASAAQHTERKTQ